MRNPLIRRWYLQRYNKVTGIVIFERGIRRNFWFFKRAAAAAERLNLAMESISRYERFRVAEYRDRPS